jgi:two-component system response regulator YesN
VSAELNDLAARISDAVRVGDRGASAERFSGFVDVISRYPGMPREQVNGYVSLVVNLASQVLSDGTYTDGGKTSVAETINAVRSADRLQLVAELVTRVLEEYASRVSVRHGDRDRAIADRVAEFVTERYAQPLSLQLLADEIGMSANYVGSVFRSVMGTGFTDYLNEVRMHKARELLGPHARVKEVASRVGVPNTSYFCVLFRKTFGLSPGEYRDSVRLRSGR